MPARPRRLSAALAAGGMAIAAVACASAALPPPEVPTRARASATYRASVRFSIAGPELRGRGRAVLAFERPDRLRVEVPGLTGLRLVAVLRDGSLLAVFPADRAVFHAAANTAALQALFGLALAPNEMMDILVGAPTSSLRSYSARWGPALPRAIDATLADGTRLRLQVEAPEKDVPIPEAAFDPPPHEAYRVVDASEARSLWGSR